MLALALACVPWLQGMSLCMYADGHYFVGPPPCEFDTGEFLLPDPCTVRIGKDEWLTVRVPRVQ